MSESQNEKLAAFLIRMRALLDGEAKDQRILVDSGDLRRLIDISDALSFTLEKMATLWEARLGIKK